MIDLGKRQCFSLDAPVVSGEDGKGMCEKGSTFQTSEANENSIRHTTSNKLTELNKIRSDAGNIQKSKKCTLTSSPDLLLFSLHGTTNQRRQIR